MGRPTISVIIPSNRGGPYLTEAVASLRAQTLPASEILLVDDGSPAPGLEDVARELGLRYLRQESSGISVARNTGVRVVDSEWVAFLDDDDLWHPDRLEAQVSALTHAPGAIACSTGGDHIDAEGRPLGEPWAAPNASAEEMLRGRVPTPRITTLLVRRDAYLAVGGCRTRMEPSEDNDLIARLLLLGEFVTVDRPLVSYRRHASNVTRRSLAGRQAGRRSMRDMLRSAKRDADSERIALMRTRQRRFVSSAADQNLGDLISAVRNREFGYGARVAAWGITLPIASLRAVQRRRRRRRNET